MARGRPLGQLCLARSTGRDAFPAEEEQAVEDLALRSALALDNARLYRELQDALRLRDEVLASTSHDLRSPLTGVRLQGVVLRRLLRNEGRVQDKVVRGLEDIDGAIGRALALIDELLDVAALQAGRRLQLEKPIAYIVLVESVDGAAANGREDVESVAGLEARVHAVLEVRGIAPVDHHVHVAPQLALIVEQVWAERGVAGD